MAIGGWRNDVSLVSNVHPHKVSWKGVGAACTRSLKRLGTDRLDLLHWRSQIIHEPDSATSEPLTPRSTPFRPATALEGFAAAEANANISNLMLEVVHNVHEGARRHFHRQGGGGQSASSLAESHTFPTGGTAPPEL